MTPATTRPASRGLTARPGLDGTTLKLIALGLMLLDHIHYFFEFTGAVPEWFSMLARLSAPLFLFCTVEGFAHTHDRRRYFLRMTAIGAPMGALTFFMMYGGFLRRPDGFYPLNGIFLNFMVLCVIWQSIDWLRARRLLAGSLAVLLPLAWPFLASLLSIRFPVLATPLGLLASSLLPAWNLITDGGLFYILGGVLLYLLRGRRALQLGVWAAWTFVTSFGLPYLTLRGTEGFALSQMFTTYYEWLGVFAVVLMALYNGRRGAGYKRLFYWFYPTHIYLLYAASWAVWVWLNR